MNTQQLDPLLRGLQELEIRSCLIRQKDRAVLEYYREPQSAAEPGRINSCTKSVVAALVCIAIDQHILPHQDTNIRHFFPQLTHDKDIRKREITLSHLLTMSAGFKWSEFGGANSFPTMTKTDDWVQFVLSQPLSDAPGSRMEYNSGCSQLLTAILRQATGQSVAAFAEQQLFHPLGIDSYRWETDPQGTHTGGFGLYLRPEDMLKFGLLHQQEGRWKESRLIDPLTLKQATSPLMNTEPPRTGYYGWHWWVSSFTNKAAETGYYHALGYGGQYIVVVPAYDLTVVVTADRFGRRRKAVNVFQEYIIPLLQQE
ncbi:serine hydrolase [Paenibacillus albidus]|uniref:serine hydrolase domain-containing protein n=1 Tax=Paenibacillus albidus TaxID=2041023 RepID=UPI001BE95313|nr:serine hydrolase [Paenibacillus albidus]MBT2290290.1 serine hydrolase [Paenibacillus albidus]